MALLGFLVVGSVVVGPFPPAAAENGFSATPVVTGLNKPVAFEFAPNGNVFVAEKDGILKVFDGIGDTGGGEVVLDWSDIIMSYLDRGLLGLAVDPLYANGRDYVYLFYTFDELPGGTNPPRWGDACSTWNTTGCTVTAKLSRIEVDPLTHDVIGGELILLEHHWCIQYTSHSNGDLEFGPDGYLYASAGEGASFTFVDVGESGGNPCQDPADEGGALRAQDLLTSVGGEAADPVSYSGSILRIDPDTGDAAAGNPLVAVGVGGDDRIIAHGMRNPYRMAFRPGTNELWFGDVGWSAWEEVNRITDVTDAVVENFGWPCYEGSSVHNGYAANPLCDGIINETLVPIVDTAKTPPYYQYSHGGAVAGCAGDSSSVSAIAFEDGSPYPNEYSGALFFGDYSRGCVWVMKSGPDGVPSQDQVELIGVGLKVTDLEIGPGGQMYVLDPVSIFQDGLGQIRRLDYQGTNSVPAASIQANTLEGETGITVFEFDGAGSIDPDGEPLVFEWDLNGDGSFDETGATLAHTYSEAGSYSVTLRVSDPHGATDEATVRVNVSNAPPTARISRPPPGESWRAGDVLNFAGEGWDPDDGRLVPDTPGQEWQWALVLHHCPSDCHQHVEATWTGVDSASFPTPDHEYPSHLELVLTVTDSVGASATSSVLLYPETSTVTVATEPAGLLVAAGISGAAVEAPVSVMAIEGGNVTLTAVSPQAVGEREYRFASWSDGGDRSHTITMPQDDLTIIAQFGLPPTWDRGSLHVSDVGERSATLSWSGAVDDVAVAGYEVWLDGELAAFVDEPGMSLTELEPVTEYEVKIHAVDDLGLRSDDGPGALVATIDETAPVWLSPPFVSVVAGGAIVEWEQPYDEHAIDRYQIELDGEVVADLAAGSTFGSVSGLEPGSYQLAVLAFDPSGNTSSTGPIAFRPYAAESRTGLGLVLNTRWSVRSDNGEPATFYFGAPGDIVFTGDWDCDGIDTPGVFRESDGYLYLRNSLDTGPADIEFHLGQRGDVPIAGDWNGDGCDTVGVYRSGHVFLTNSLGSGGVSLVADEDSWFGISGDVPFSGDFDLDGKDELGLFRPGSGFVYYTLELPGDGSAAATFDAFFYGAAGDVIVVGDWTNYGEETVGVYRQADDAFYLRYSNSLGIADEVVAFPGGGTPVTGRFG